MTYRHDSAQSRKKKLLAIFAALFFFYVLMVTPVGDFTARFLQRFAPPLWEISTRSSSLTSGVFTVFSSKQTLLRENANLEKEMRDLSIKLLDRNLLYEENLALKERLGRGNYGQTVFARVLAKPSKSLYDTLVIDIGRREGVEKGDTVLYENSIMIGTIAAVFETTSVVKLFSSSGEDIDVTIGSKGIPAVAKGHGGGNFEIMIPRDAQISKGDSISAPSLVLHLLGVVEYIEEKPNDPLLRILFKSPVPLFEIEAVDVLIEQ